MTERPFFLLVFNTIYTYIKDQRKWAKMRISGLLFNENFRISFETYFTITCMQTEKNQGKINFRIVGVNFCINLHLAISLRIIQYLALHKNLYSWMRYIFVHFFPFIASLNTLQVFCFPLYFLFENGIDPVFSFIMSYLQLHRKRE